MKDYYEPKYVESLFNEMSNSYAKVNYITSFGFSRRWRNQCVDKALFLEEGLIVDLMTGMGESWNHILKNTGNDSRLIGLDISEEMLKRAKQKQAKLPDYSIELLHENVFNNSISENSVDIVISCFGLKTFNEIQLNALAIEIKRILKPNGRFSLIEVSIPDNLILRKLYLFYLKRVIPILGRLFLGNPENYEMLGFYTERFINCKKVLDIFKKQKLKVRYEEYFWGCATGIVGELEE